MSCQLHFPTKTCLENLCKYYNYNTVGWDGVTTYMEKWWKKCHWKLVKQAQRWNGDMVKALKLECIKMEKQLSQ